MRQAVGTVSSGRLRVAYVHVCTRHRENCLAHGRYYINVRYWLFTCYYYFCLFSICLLGPRDLTTPHLVALSPAWGSRIPAQAPKSPVTEARQSQRGPETHPRSAIRGRSQPRTRRSQCPEHFVLGRTGLPPKSVQVLPQSLTMDEFISVQARGLCPNRAGDWVLPVGLEVSWRAGRPRPTGKSQDGAGTSLWG